MSHNTDILHLFRHQEGTAFAAGCTIFDAGSSGATMYVVLDGEVEIRVGGVQVEIARSGSIFGEMALIDDEPRSATVTVKTDCRLLEIDRRRFEFLVAQTPYFALAVMRIMAERLRSTNARGAST